MSTSIYAQPEDDLTNYSYEPASDVEEDEDLAKNSTEEVPHEVKYPEDVEDPNTNPMPENLSPSTENESVTGGLVPGFQMVKAKGMADTSTPEPTGSAIPNFATATPMAKTQLPQNRAKRYSMPLQPPVPLSSNNFSNPLDEYSKSKQFAERTDFMISEFFTRQVARLTAGAPEALNRSYRYELVP
jgi:hypothetical protein